MTLPAEITTGILTWDIASLVRDASTGNLVEGDLSAGSITFTATPKLLLDQGVTNLILLPAPITTPMTAGQQELILTDCAAVSPSGWTWVATATLPGGFQMDPIPFELTSADLDVNGKAKLAALTPLPQTNGVPITRGVVGPPGGTMVLTDNGNGTATFSWVVSGVTDTADVPTLSGGKLDPGTLPALAVITVFTVSSQAAMLALTAQQGDIAVRTDEGNKYILTASDPTVLANWVLLVSSAYTSSEITDATTIGRTILTAASAAAVNTALGLGTAALADTGTGPGNVPVLNASGRLDMARLAAGTPNGSQFVRDDGTLATPALASPTWTTAVITGSTTPSGTQAVRYCKDALGWVNVEGSFQLTSGNAVPVGGTLFTLPAGMRPSATESLTLTTAGTSTGSPVNLAVSSAGAVTNNGSNAIAVTVPYLINGRFYVG